MYEEKVNTVFLYDKSTCGRGNPSAMQSSITDSLAMTVTLSGGMVMLGGTGEEGPRSLVAEIGWDSTYLAVY